MGFYRIRKIGWPIETMDGFHSHAPIGVLIHTCVQLPVLQRYDKYNVHVQCGVPVEAAEGVELVDDVLLVALDQLGRVLNQNKAGILENNLPGFPKNASFLSQKKKSLAAK